MTNKRVLSLVLVLAIIVAMILPVGMPVYAGAGIPTLLDISQGDIIINALGASGGGLATTETSLNTDGYVITGTTTTNKIVVDGVKANITLASVTIKSLCAFELTGSANVTLTIIGTNTLESRYIGTIQSQNEDCKAGIHVVGGTKILIKGTGTLNATGVSAAAGIGGGRYGSCGTIQISDNVTVNASGDGAGIGAGAWGQSGTIIIDGGTVNATGIAGAGIGGAFGGGIDYSGSDGGNITISGGSVKATGGDGAGIGGGTGNVLKHGGSGGNITISGGTVIATGGSFYGRGGAGIGGGSGGTNSDGAGGSGGIITILGGTVTATGGEGAAGIGGGKGSDGASGIITINAAATVKASSNSTNLFAIDGALAAGSTATILMANYSIQKIANVNTQIYNKASSLITEFAPINKYTSIAFTVPEAITYQLKTANIFQQHDVNKDFVVVNGLTTINNVIDVVLTTVLLSGPSSIEVPYSSTVNTATYTAQGKDQSGADMLSIYDYIIAGSPRTGIMINNVTGILSVDNTTSITSNITITIYVSSNITTNINNRLDVVILPNPLVVAMARIPLTQANYTVDSWSRIAAALLLPESTNAEEEIKAIVLNTAIDDLISNVDFTRLNVEIEEANSIINSIYAINYICDALNIALLLPQATYTELWFKIQELSDALRSSTMKPLTSSVYQFDYNDNPIRIIGNTLPINTSQSVEGFLSNIMKEPTTTIRFNVIAMVELQNIMEGIYTSPDEFFLHCKSPTDKLAAGDYLLVFTGIEISIYEIVVTEASNEDIAAVAAVATVKGAVSEATYTMTQAVATDEAAVKAAIEAKIATLALDGVAAVVTRVLYTPAVTGDAGTPAGTNGIYKFTVGLSKVGAADTTAMLTMTVTATAFDVVAANLAAAKLSEAALTSTNYVSYSAVTTAMALPETTDAERNIKTTAINNAIAALVLKADLTAYNTALAAVTEANYTVASWTTYQLLVAANVVTVANSQIEVDAATSAITTVQGSLVTLVNANLAAVATVKGVVSEVIYTITQAVATDEAAVKAAIEAKIATLALDGVAAVVTKVLYIPAVAGNAGTPAGTNGTYTFTVGLSKGGATDTTAILTITVVTTAYVTPTSSGTSSYTPPVIQPKPGADILVNGDTVNAGTAVDTTKDGKTTTTIIIDEKKLEQKLATEGNSAVVTIPVNTKADVVVGELNGQMIKNMENTLATIEVKTVAATYTLPAQQINIDAISQQLGKNVELKDIKVLIEIAKPTQETVKVVENSAKAGEFTIVAAPVEFNVSCTYGGKTIDVSKFNAYVQRKVAIPEDVDYTKITTGVIIDADGTVRHVPTKIVIIDGKYYAKINSLTNSIYSVVWNQVEFKDVETHWAKASINDMGSRMIISGIGNDLFEPNRDITRAEFAAIVVKSLGLKPGTDNNSFVDVKSPAWYCGYIETAYEYGIISGYGNGKFGPMDKISHEQAMTMVAKAMKITGLKVEFSAGEADKLLAAFGDSGQSSAWAKESITTCIKAGILPVQMSKALEPKVKITRAEVAVIIRRLLQKSGLI
ncbi:MAG TPA: S-layer homology domain-containing protein [Ruminiclostridium sp.]